MAYIKATANEERERLRGEDDKIKFIDFRFEKKKVFRIQEKRKARLT